MSSNMNNTNSPSQQVEHAFSSFFGEAAHGIYRSPGRVNLIGEHTDYNDGFVLPAAIQFYTAIAAAPRDDMLVEAIALDHNNSRVQIDLQHAMQNNKQAPWSDYLAGVIMEVQQRGHRLRGMNLVISGNVPQGAGLSSSASFEMAIAAALKDLNKLSLEGREAALIGQAAENNFVGCKCGIMDQLISALGKKAHAMLLDCRSLETQFVSLPENLRLIIINSNVKRGLVDSEYNLRRQQCETAAAHFGVKALRDINIEQLESGKAGLSDVVYRRARHVVTENQRTLDAAAALAKNDISVMGELMAASHASMRDDFEITVQPVNQLVSMVQDVLGSAGGVRMTGGGFGGCVVALAPAEFEADICATVKQHYSRLSGLQESIYICESADGGFS